MSSPTNGIIFPIRPRHPKAAVFLRCPASHVFAITSLKGDPPAEKEVAHIFGPCPQCPRTSVYPHATASHACAFCDRRLAYDGDGVQCCRTETCWVSRARVETGTEETVKLWARVYRDEVNAYFFGREQGKARAADDLRGVTEADLQAARILVAISKGFKD
ncbi:hypothetical protein NKR19_g3357 [Coniochaeta hoffmannii]|uniref:Uncharacterized protein n=1 Tax=Coniochaeta hoffmannii TaxID=91930 RepID=A0AA38RXA4_9PEZI|nr:hypothetical protein NKR19_g3357 [Coniochaeta hoffmannii]